jgi:cytosine/adenosine deaminase-related metal-dependent hydrolase
LIGKDILLSHATGISPTEAQQIITGGAHISSTPTTELQMSLGEPVCFHPLLSSVSSLGVDCHSAAAADIPGQMRLILQYARGRRNQGLLDRGRTPRTVRYRVEEVFNLGTVKGARAVGMEDQVGKLAVGMRADLVVWDGLSSGMVGAVQQDPVAAIVVHSSVRDVDTVIVDGIIRKRYGKLVPVAIGGNIGEQKTERIEWRDIARRVVETRDRIQEKVKGIDYEKVRPMMFKAFYVDEGTLSDTPPSDDK